MGRFSILGAAILVVLSMVTPAGAQIYDLRELNNLQIDALPRDRTVVLMPGGILEQHGPYLPSYTDGYVNEYVARQIAHAIIARPGWVVLMFPPIPLGAGGVHLRPNLMWPGTIHVHFEALRAVYMDLASELGEKGFRWVFVIQDHGGGGHNRALDQASDFFTDTYQGRMVHLGGLVLPPSPLTPPLLPPEGQNENGLDVHGGMSETSRILFLRPDLVGAGRERAAPFSGGTWEELVKVGSPSSWLGYFGSPRLASAALGAEILRRRVEAYTALVLRILDGFDPRSLPREVDRQDADTGRVRYNAIIEEHEQRIRVVQQDWLSSKGLR